MKPKPNNLINLREVATIAGHLLRDRQKVAAKEYHPAAGRMHHAPSPAVGQKTD